MSAQVEEVAEQKPVQKPEIKPRKRRFGDRYDGYRVRDLDLPFHIMPVIMPKRCDSEVFFKETIDIGPLEDYVRKKRKEDLPELKTLHVILAAMVRVLAVRPRMNRFIIGKKVYAHNNIRFGMTIKRSLSMEGEETEVLPEFLPTDTIYDVVKTFNEEWEKAVNAGEEGNDADRVTRLLAFVPTWVKTFSVWVLRKLDQVGLLPKSLYKGSPFHNSIYITDVGSLGIDSVYHHLFEFGTNSCFLAVGKKITEHYITSEGEIAKRKVMNFRFVVDERICDGYYHASAIKLFCKYLKHPELLEIPPESLPDEI